jgi:hypothetical protein
VRAASWDLSQVHLADPKTGVILYRLFPLDKQKNARGERSGKGSPVDRPALRGSSELAGCGDSNLYMRRRGAQLTLSTEHRASQPGGPMELLPIFCVARFSRTDLSMLVARALKIGKIADGGMHPTYETMH